MSEKLEAWVKNWKHEWKTKGMDDKTKSMDEKLEAWVKNLKHGWKTGSMDETMQNWWKPWIYDWKNRWKKSLSKIRSMDENK